VLASNIINYMRYAAADLVGCDLAEKPHPTDPEQWCMRSDNPNLADHMAQLGYKVTTQGNGWIGVSGKPTNTDRVRDLEIRKAQARVEQIRDKDPERIMQMTTRF